MSVAIAVPGLTVADSDLNLRLRRWREWIVLAAYTSLIALMIPYYEPWADEAQAWQLAGYASLKDLFVNQLRHEGHPGLWHLILHFSRHLHLSYVGLHWATGAMAVFAVSLLIFRSPFPFIARAILPFTFFLAFQYAVVARSYALTPLLLFATAVMWKRSSAIPLALLLGLLANVALHATAISVGFAAVYALELRRGIRQARYIYWALAIFVLLSGVAVFTVFPQPSDLLGPGLPEHDSAFVVACLWVLKAVIFTGRGLISCPWYLGLGALTMLVWGLWSRVSPRYCLPLLTLAAFSGFFFQFWHLGLVLLTGITVCWIIWPIRLKTPAHTTAAAAALWLAIFTQLLYTVYALVYDHRHAYSPDLAASRYLEPYVAAHVPIAVGYVKNVRVRTFDSVGLRPYLSGPIFLNEPDPFWTWRKDRHTRAEFNKALNLQPRMVVVEYYDDHFRPFNLERESTSQTIEHLQDRGYVLTHTFCGAKPEDMREREHICHLIFQPKSSSATSNTR